MDSLAGSVQAILPVLAVRAMKKKKTAEIRAKEHSQ
jgi:hypothetical protein